MCNRQNAGASWAPLMNTASLVKNGVLAACAVAFVGFVYSHDREQRASLARAEQRLAQASEAMDEARASIVSRDVSARAAFVAPASAADPALADSVAARVMKAQNERAKAEGAIAADASQPSAEVLSARSDAQRTLDGAVARGVLSRDDVLAIRRTLANDPAGRAAAARQIAVAVNDNKLVPADARNVFP
jgi:hypothetical protein